jgi:hypothetical protein
MNHGADKYPQKYQLKILLLRLKGARQHKGFHSESLCLCAFVAMN